MEIQMKFSQSQQGGNSLQSTALVVPLHGSDWKVVCSQPKTFDLIHKALIQSVRISAQMISISSSFHSAL